jgi:beta-lactam-binding protein with PASTA domain/tRNA A-37 threonylcarbamoyl transferase component Bud32
MSVSDTLINTLFDGRYRIVRKLGSGGMANVYLAEDEELGRRVAIKILNDRYANDELFIERFRREAKSAASLSHPNIVSIYDRGEAEGTYYIAMEVIEGRSLKELILTRGDSGLPVHEAIDYAKQILHALRFAHRNGIIHRDIKPHNILVGAENRLKVTDFGIARAGPSQMTEVGSIMGTAQYLSPEQARGAAVTAASDLYSVGVVMYEMLTGRVPYTGDSPIEVAMKHVNDAPRLPSELRGNGRDGIPPELDLIVLRALAKDPADRYQSADEFLEDLERATAGVPVAPETETAATALLAGTSATQVLRPPEDHTSVLPPRQPPPMPPRARRAYGYEPPPPQRRKRSVLPWIVVFGLLIAAAIAGWYVFTQVQDELDASKPVAVPYVIGLREDNAVAKIEEAGLEVDVQREATTEAQEGFVFDQEPKEGTRISPGETVTLVVSTGVPKVEVPKVTGLQYDEAVQVLNDAKLEATKNEVFSQKPAGQVLAQDPKPGTEVAEGEVVTLRVSKGQETATVPDVLQQDQASAEAELQAAGFEVEAVEVPSSEAAGLVVAQSPDPGVEAPKGSTVQINVSEGPQTASVPNVVGLDEGSAIGTLEGEGFAVSVVDAETSDLTQDGIVIGQDPSGGVQAEPGSTVSITVGRFVEPTTTGATEETG